VAHKAAADGVEFGHGRPNSLSSKAALTKIDIDEDFEYAKCLVDKKLKFLINYLV